MAEANIENSELNEIKSDVPLSKRRLILLQTGKLSDCSFIVGEELDESEKDLNAKSDDSACTKQFHCHKMILATASDVFERMFYGSFTDQPNPIKVSDIRPQNFEVLLTYIYTDQIDPQHVREENFCELMYIGDKYMMHHFIARCVDVLKNTTCSLTNTLPIFDFGCFLNNLSVILMSYENIRTYSSHLLDHPTFYNLNINNMMRLMVFLKQLPNKSYGDDKLLCALVKYGRRNNLRNIRHSESFAKLIEVALIFSDKFFTPFLYDYFFGSR